MNKKQSEIVLADIAAESDLTIKLPSKKVSELVKIHFFFSSRRRHTRCGRDWSSDVCSSDLPRALAPSGPPGPPGHRSQGPRGAGSSGRDRGSGERRVGKECRSRWSPYH